MFWFKFWLVIEFGGWVIFMYMEVVFVVGLLFFLVKKVLGYVVFVVLMGYLMFNIFINVILM